MAEEISSKSELASLASKLSEKSKNLTDLGEDLKTDLVKAQDYDGISVSAVGNVLSANFDNVLKDLDVIATNIKTYVSQVIGFDVDDFDSNDIEAYLDGVGGSSINLPGGLGNIHTYMGWQCITAKSSNQYKLREAAGMNFDSNGFGKIGDRYVVATTTTFGKVGDYIDVVQNDGSVIKCIIGDIKNQGDAGCNQWGHNDGHCVVEFVVDKDSWYGTNNTVTNFHPEWNQNISKIVNKGNYFDLSGQYNTNVHNTSTTTSGTWNALSGAGSAITSYVASGGYTAPSYTTVNNSAPQLHLTSVELSSGNPDIDISKYHNNLDMGFEVTTGNLAYKITDQDYELLCAIVSAESDKSYDDALAVITTILNRCEDERWIASHGADPIAQATAPNQFVVYQHGSYRSYMDGKAPMEVQIAVRDALAGVRNHNYLSFRSNGTTSYSNNMITATGNRYK